MDRGKYLTIQQQLVALANFVMAQDEEELKEFINIGARSLTMSSIFHPTLAMMGGKQLQGVMQIARATLKFRKEVAEAIDLVDAGARTAQSYRAMGVEL